MHKRNLGINNIAQQRRSSRVKIEHIERAQRTPLNIEQKK